jgi:hypothetical protein
VSPRGNQTEEPAKAARGKEQCDQRLIGKLMETFSLLFQSEDRFVSYIRKGRQKGSKLTGEVRDSVQAA